MPAPKIVFRDPSKPVTAPSALPSAPKPTVAPTEPKKKNFEFRVKTFSYQDTDSLEFFVEEGGRDGFNLANLTKLETAEKIVIILKRDILC